MPARRSHGEMTVTLADCYRSHGEMTLTDLADCKALQVCDCTELGTNVSVQGLVCKNACWTCGPDIVPPVAESCVLPAGWSDSEGFEPELKFRELTTTRQNGKIETAALTGC